MNIELNGSRPPINIWDGVFMYQGKGGISEGILLVAQGASNSERRALPIMPPILRNGTMISIHIRNIATMVPNGRAAVAR